MTQVVVSARTGRDVREILYRLNELAGAAVAEKYARELASIYQRLAMFPASGARRTSLGANARIAVLDPYVVVYDNIGDDVVIVRVIDGRRKITRHLVRE